MDLAIGPFLLRSNGLWWRGDRCGYTSSLAEAGLYSAGEAHRWQGPSYADKGIEAVPLSRVEGELRAIAARAAAMASGDALARRLAYYETMARDFGILAATIARSPDYTLRPWTDWARLAGHYANLALDMREAGR